MLIHSSSQKNDMKKIMFLLVSIFTSITLSSQTKVGQDINGVVPNDTFGRSVSLNSDGTVMAIGAIGNDGNGPDSGHTRIFALNGSNWTQVGGDIRGLMPNSRSGWSVSLSSDGNTVAIGAPNISTIGSNNGHTRIYAFNGTSWVQLGADIFGNAPGDRSGYSVSLSSDGSTVAIGEITNAANGNISGRTRIFTFNGTSWLQVGLGIIGEVANDSFGYSVSLSSDGNTVAIGAIGNDANGNNSGYTQVYTYNSTNWIQVGSNIVGLLPEDQSGYSVSLSSDGNTVAIGSPFNDGNGPNSGHTRIFTFNNTNWVQVGSNINGETVGDRSGQSVSLSSDGSTVAIGANVNNNNTGHTRIFSLINGNWIQVGNVINGQLQGDQSGFSVSLSDGGNRVVIGAPFNDINGPNSGLVRVYDITLPNQAPTAICQNVTVSLDETGNATISAEDINNGSTDPDMDSLSFSLDVTSFNCNNLGDNTVTLTVNDGNGGEDTCTATVTVEDNTAPVPDIGASVLPNAPATAQANVTEALGYGVLYEYNISNTPNFSTSVPYNINNSGLSGLDTSRIAYFMELDSQWVWVSLDDFTGGDLTAMGLPSFGSNPVNFDNLVTNMNVFSNVSSIVTGTNIATGNVEMWPQNYGTPQNQSLGSLTNLYDFDDTANTPVANGFGSFQIHNYGESQTLFSFNHFNQGVAPDLGIGNQPTSHPDWTTASNGPSYTNKTIYILLQDGLPKVMAECEVASITPPTATDNCDAGTITGTTTTSFPITESTTVVWTFTDSSGNSSTVTQPVVIEIPEITYDNVNGWSPAAPNSSTTECTNVIVESGSVTLAENFIAGNLTVNTGASLTIEGFAAINSNLVNNGTLDATAGTLQFFGNNDHIISGESPIMAGNVTITASTPSRTLSLNNNNPGSGALNDTRILEVYGLLNVFNNTLVTNDQLVFKSNASGTGILDVIDTDDITRNGTINGPVVVERYNSANRAYRLLSAPLASGSLKDNWMEGVNNADTNTNLNPNPGFGTHITGSDSSWDATTTNNPSVFGVNNLGIPAAYTTVATSNEEFNYGKGFLLFVRGDRGVDLSSNASEGSTVLRAKGTLMTGNLVLNSSFLNTGDNFSGGNGSSLIGNPYQAPVDMAQVLENSQDLNEDAYHIYDPTIGDNGAFVTVTFETVILGTTIPESNSFSFPADETGNMVSDSDANRFLQPGQAAFINSEQQISDADGTLNPILTFREADKFLESTNDGVFKQGTQQISSELGILSVALFQDAELANNDKPRDAVLVRFNDGYTNEIGVGDSYKSFNIDENLSTVVNEKSLSIESRLMPVELDEVLLKLTNYRVDNYTFRIAIGNLENVNAYLIDNYLDTSTALSQGEINYISFSIDGTEGGSIADNRFKIVFQENILATKDDKMLQFGVYPNPNLGEFAIQFGTDTTSAQVTLHNLLGQEVFENSFVNISNNQIKISDEQLQSGIYILKVTSNNQTATKRLIIK